MEGFPKIGGWGIPFFGVPRRRMIPLHITETLVIQGVL